MEVCRYLERYRSLTNSSQGNDDAVVVVEEEAMSIAHTDAMEHLATAHEFLAYAERNTAEGLTPEQMVRILGETRELLQEVWISIFADETGHTCLDERIRRHMNKIEFNRIVKELEEESSG